MTNSNVKVISLSDLHLGHPNNPAERMIANLRALLPDNPTMDDVDILFLAGDVFDRALSLPQHQIDEISLWVFDLLSLCARRDISLYVLEGTPSHDFGQSKMFVSQNASLLKATGKACRLQYVTDVRIIKDEPTGLDILFVPDEWRPDTKDTWLDVCKALREKGLEKVDIAVMHGAFPHQLPPQVKCPLHDTDSYLGIVRYMVFIGHVHLHSVYERIIAHGSTDRISHGEESPKGIIKATLNTGEETFVAQFVENVNAMVFKTIDCTGMGLEEALAKVACYTTLPLGSSIRIKANRSDAIINNIAELKKQYPGFRWDKPKITGDVKLETAFMDSRMTYESVELNDRSLRELLSVRISESRKATPELIARAIKELEDVL